MRVGHKKLVRSVGVTVVIVALLSLAGLMLKDDSVESTWLGGIKSQREESTSEDQSLIKAEVVGREFTVDTTENETYLGSQEAPTTIYMWLDLQCDECRRFWNSAGKTLRDEYVVSNRVKLAYRDFPQNIVNPRAQAGAEAARCAEEQGKLWEFIDRVYAGQGKLSALNLKSAAKGVGVEEDQFQECVANGKYSDQILEAVLVAENLGVERAPSWSVGNELFYGIPSDEQLMDLLN